VRNFALPENVGQRGDVAGPIVDDCKHSKSIS
jgi:hypothetical protein